MSAPVDECIHGYSMSSAVDSDEHWKMWGGPSQECKSRKARIAELEEENARLKSERETAWDLGNIQYKRERDEARAKLEESHSATFKETIEKKYVAGLRDEFKRLEKERDEARAACAAKDEALRLQDPRNSTERYERIADAFYDKHHRMAPGQSRPMEMGSDPDPDETQRLWRDFCNEWHEAFFDAALSSTCGSELLARVEKAEAELAALRDSEAKLDGVFNEQQAQLESMRAALEEARERIESAPVAHPMLTEATMLIGAALLPSAPRLYRNLVIDECLNAASGLYPHDQDVLDALRALKDPVGLFESAKRIASASGVLVGAMPKDPEDGT